MTNYFCLQFIMLFLGIFRLIQRYTWVQKIILYLQGKYKISFTSTKFTFHIFVSPIQYLPSQVIHRNGEGIYMIIHRNNKEVFVWL